MYTNVPSLYICMSFLCFSLALLLFSFVCLFSPVIVVDVGGGVCFLMREKNKGYGLR